MPSVKAIDLINSVSVTLQDASFVRWTQVELLAYLNEAQRQIVAHRPDARVVNASFTCVASAKQTLPSNGLRLIGVTTNVNGPAITKVKRTILDVSLPNWYNTALGADGAVKHYVYDQLDPKTFYLFPKPPVSHAIEIIYSETPPTISVSNFVTDVQVIGLDDIYANAIMDYMVYRAYAKDSEYGNLNRATAFLQAFQNGLEIKTRGDGVVAQNIAQNDPRGQQ
jgi:hypothetical protein